MVSAVLTESAQARPVTEAIARVLAQARRVQTPCGAEGGHLVWHAWGGGAGADPVPLVLLHGGSGSWTHWLRNIEALVAAGREVWAPDLPGFGESDGVPGGLDADTMLAPLQAGLQTLFGNKACDLVGFSFGGMTAGMFTAAYPDAVRQLVLVGAPGLGVGDGRRARLLGWRHLESAQAREQAHRHNLQALMLHDPAAIDADTLALHANNVVRDRLPRRRLSQTEVLAQALGRVSCPVQAIYGVHDVLYVDRHADLQQVLERAAPRFAGLHWVADSGHWVQYEQPQRFDAQLLACLELGLKAA